MSIGRRCEWRLAEIGRRRTVDIPAMLLLFLWPGAGPAYEYISAIVLGLEVGHLRGYTDILFSALGLEMGHLRG